MISGDTVPGYEDLLKPPPRRARGIKADYWLTVLVLGFGLIMILGGLLPISLYVTAALMAVWLLGGIYGLSPQWRSVWYSRRKHRRVWDAIKRLADPQRGERHIEVMPELKVEGRTLFVASYRHRLDRQRLVPIATLLFDDKGRVIENDELFEKAYTVYNFGLSTLGRLQGELDDWQRKNRRLLKRKLPKAKAVIGRNRRAFEAVGAGNHADQAVQGLTDFEAALREVDRFLAARQGYVKAVGYGHHPVYLYEDADRFERLSVTFAKKLASEHGQRLQELSLVGELLLHELEQRASGWRNRKGLERTLKLVAGARLAIQKWIDDFGDEARVPELSWKNYHNKIRAVRNQGVPIYSG